MKEYNVFFCESCEDKTEFEHKAFIAHITEKHGFKEGLEGMRSMILHVDGRDYYKSKFGWEIKISDSQKINFTQETCNIRGKDDMMRYA